MTWKVSLAERVRPRIALLYGTDPDAITSQIVALAEQYAPRIPASLSPQSEMPVYDERDAVLICYGDNVHATDERPLATLEIFLTRDGLHELIPIAHLLPFFPYSSDDGFSVIDYRRIDPALGDWSDLERLGERLDLMFDLVLNHCSQHSDYFQRYLKGEEPYTRFFIEADPADDLSQVMRPRSLPLLTEFETSRGPRHVWTTFSADQVDLNFAEPAVLLELLDVFLMFLARASRITRLDAVAFLWKQVGTPCIHLPQTHEVIKLMRDLVDAIAPRCRLLTETNVPHAENISYLGHGDEAHMIYQFSLAPLLLDAYYQRDATVLSEWLAGLESLPAGSTYFNFTASHDGVGLRPAEGLLPQPRIDALVEAVLARGGRVSMRRRPDGGESPYELNISYFDALGFPNSVPSHGQGRIPDSAHIRRFLASQAIMLALRGIPGIYFHSLCGTPNDYEGLAATGHNRSINRRKYRLDELDVLLGDPQSPQSIVHQGYRRMLRVRQQQPAMHPDAAQRVVRFDDLPLLAFVRESLDGGQRLLVLANLSDEELDVDLSIVPALTRHHSFTRNLLGQRPLDSITLIHLEAYEAAWLT